MEDPGLPGWPTHLLFLLLALVPVFFLPYSRDSFEFHKASLLTLFALAAIALLPRELVHVILNTLSPRNLRRDWITLAVVLLLLSAAISTFCSVDPWTSFFGEPDSRRGLLCLASCVLLYLVVRSFPVAPDHLIGACLLAASVVAGYALTQALGIDFLAWEGRSLVGESWRPHSTMGHPIHAGSYLAVLGPWLLYYGLRAWKSGGIHQAWPWVLLGALTLGAITLSLSRGAWLGCALGMGTWLLLGINRTLLRNGLVTCLCLAGAVALMCAFSDLPHRLWQRLCDSRAWSDRHAIWEIAGNMFWDQPLIGVGPDLFHLRFANHRTIAHWTREWDTTPAHAHNEFLHVLATQGALGGLATLVLVVGCLLAAGCLRRRMALEAGDKAEQMRALLASSVATLSIALLSFVTPGLAPLLIVLVALLSRTAYSTMETRNYSTVTSHQMVGVAFVGIFIANAIDGSRTSWFHVVLVLGALIAVCGVSLYCTARGAADGASHRSAFVLFRFTPCRLVLLMVVGAATYRLVLCPWMAENALLRGSVHVKQDPELALGYLESAASWHSSPPIWEAIAEAAQNAAEQTNQPRKRQALLQQAKIALEHCLTRQPTSPLHHHNLGRLLGRMAVHGLAEPAHAIQVLDHALTLDPVNPILCSEATEVALAFNADTAAQKWLQKSLEQFPQYPPLIEQAGHLAVRQGRFEEGIAKLEESIQRPGGITARQWLEHLASLCLANYHLGRFSKLDEHVKLALYIDPSAVDFRCILAAALEQQGLWAQADVEYEYVLRLRPFYEVAMQGRERISRYSVKAIQP